MPALASGTGGPSWKHLQDLGFGGAEKGALTLGWVPSGNKGSSAAVCPTKSALGGQTEAVVGGEAAMSLARDGTSGIPCPGRYLCSVVCRHDRGGAILCCSVTVPEGPGLG